MDGDGRAAHTSESMPPGGASGGALPADLDIHAVRAQFVRKLRHELRTPLNHIIGYSEILLETAGDLDLPSLAPDLERIHGAGQHLLRQVDRFLGPDQLEAGTLDAALLSHELRTPLNAIVGYTEILLEAAAELGQPDVVLDLEKIHSASKHLLGLVGYALDLARIESGETDGARAAPTTAAPRATVPPTS